MKFPAASFLLAPRARRLAAVLLAAVLACRALPVRADEITRRIQEELRKRNLYFGDVDGRLSPQLAAALHRYQERKGFSSTGETDEETMDSLNIAPPAAPLARAATPAATAASVPPPLDTREGGSANSWPDITVLRSDEARPAPPGEVDAAVARADPSPAATPAPPPAAGRLRRPTDEEAQDYVARYLDAGAHNREETELAFYGDRVSFYDEGNVDHAYLARAVDHYDHRWPERRFTVAGPVALSAAPDGDPDKFVVNFRLEFNVKNARYTVVGKTDNTWTVVGHDPGSWKIVSMKEQRVREK